MAAGTVLNHPEIAFTGGAGAEVRILIEENQIPYGEAPGQREVGTKARGQRRDKVTEQGIWKWIIAADYGKNTVGGGTDSVLYQGNCAYARAGFGGRTPQDIGDAKVEGFHQAVGQGG